MKYLLVAALVALPHVAASQAAPRAPLSETDIADITTLVMLEDNRRFDDAELAHLLKSSHAEVRRRAALSIGRIANPLGRALLEGARGDADTAVEATIVFATAQLYDTAALPWLDSLLSHASTPPTVATEAARALGMIRTADARASLSRYLLSATAGSRAAPTIGEALLSIGRHARGDLAPIVRWTTASDVEVRWRAAWALFRPRDPASVTPLLALTNDRAAVVRSWAVRGLTWPQVDSSGVDATRVRARLRAMVTDADRTVRTEALRALATHPDSASMAVVGARVKSDDAWMSVSATEGLAALRALSDTSAQGRGGRGRAGGGGGGGGGRGRGRPPIETGKTDADYRRIVEQWVVPQYNGTPHPRIEWTTPRGTFEIEIYAADAPLATDYLINAVRSGAIVGTEFTRLVPDFVAQQRAFTGAVVVRDEVNRHRLTRENVSWASAGLDTGRPGYTLGHTPQPHNEGNFTSLGRVSRGMNVVDHLEMGDKVTGARIIP